MQLQKHKQEDPSDNFKRRMILTVTVILLVIAGYCYFYKPDTSQRTAEISYREQQPAATVSDFAVSSKQIYIYYDKFGLVEAYDLFGEYICSITVYCPRNGKGEIGLDGDVLYIKDRAGNIYCFEDNEQIGFYKNDAIQISDEIYSAGRTGYTLASGQLIADAQNAVILDLADSSFYGVYTNCAIIIVVVFAVVIGFSIKNKGKQ